MRANSALREFRLFALKVTVGGVVPADEKRNVEKRKHSQFQRDTVFVFQPFWPKIITFLHKVGSKCRITIIIVSRTSLSA